MFSTVQKKGKTRSFRIHFPSFFLDVVGQKRTDFVTTCVVNNILVNIYFCKNNGTNYFRLIAFPQHTLDVVLNSF